VNETRPKRYAPGACAPTSRATAARPHAWFTVLMASLIAACAPTVKVATDEPITINLNINIQHEIRVKVERELDDLFSDDSELF